MSMIWRASVNCSGEGIIGSEFPCSPDLLQHIVRDEKGRTDFIFDWQRLGRTLEIPVGFIGVLQSEELKAELTLCGVKLPAEDVPGSEPDAPPGKLITPILAAALLIGYVIHEVQTNDKLFLTFRGEQTTASITAFHPFHHLKGSRNKGQWVTYYHPILQFRTAQQTGSTSHRPVGRQSTHQQARRTGGHSVPPATPHHRHAGHTPTI